MGYRDRLCRYGRPSELSEHIVRIYFQAPEAIRTAADVAGRDKWAADDISKLESLLADLKEYRLALAARYAELETMAYRLELRITRRNYSVSGIQYAVELVKIMEDGSEVNQLREVYKGKERHTAIARFEALKKEHPGITAVKDIEKSKWER